MGRFAQLIRRFRPRRDNEVANVDLSDLQRRIGYHFRDRQLLTEALKHRSYVYEQQGKGVDSNERLEYLGDAVLDLIVADYLFRKFQNKREGELTQMKSLVVSRTVLSRKARAIDLGRYLLLSRDERNANGQEQPSILSDGFEALIGAIYLDGGLEASRRFVDRVVLHDFQDLIARQDFVNFKSRLLELTQSQGSGHPKYFVHSEEGPDHNKTFSVEVCMTGESLGRGRGRSKKEAQQMAAKDALRRLGEL